MEMSTSNNVLSADNQQERLSAYWISGFVDGEGCFHVSINRLPKMSLGWQVLPEFRVVQHEKDEKVLKCIQSYFGFGQVVVNHGNRKEFRVRGIEPLSRIIQFFKMHPLKTSKQKDFEIFSEILEMMKKGEHLKKEGLDKIAKLSSQMNRKTDRLYLESPETIRLTN
jgi:hypothetical protein